MREINFKKLLQMKNEEQKIDNQQGNGVLPCVSEPLLWKDIVDEFYVKYDRQISSGQFKGRLLLVFKEWLEENWQVPERNVR
jgi:hypothetical protein